KVAETVGQTRRVQNGEIGFRRRAEVVEGLEETEARFGDQGPSVISHAGDRFGYPGWVTGEQIVIFRRAEEADDSKFDDEIVNDLLRLNLGERALNEIPLEIDVKES